MSEDQQVFYHLGVALAIGLLIGAERGWKERETVEGERVAGLRTYGLIGLLGGGSALLAEYIGSLAVGLGLLGFSVMLTAVYVVNLHRGQEDAGITSLVASLLTFVFGALAASGEVAVAAAFAVITTLLLGYKPQLHHWLSVLEGKELRAGLKLLLISVVLLPVLPNRGFGPWQALNPYAIWWMVVLIAALSFVGYFAVKLQGTGRGTIFTGLFGGLVSSTALTLHFSRMARRNAGIAPMLATGILLACGTMFPRMLLLASLLNPQLFRPLLLPAAVMACLVYVPALWQWRSHRHASTGTESPVTNPLELKAALSFGVLLALVILLSKALRTWFGDAGVFVLAAASGVADVDAITLSLAGMTEENLSLSVVVVGIVLAAAVNTLTKGGMALAIGGRALALRVGLPLLASAVCGLTSAWLWMP